MRSLCYHTYSWVVTHHWADTEYGGSCGPHEESAKCSSLSTLQLPPPPLPLEDVTTPIATSTRPGALLIFLDAWII